MEEKIKIIADSTCDLSKELIEKYDVEIHPLMINLGDKTYRDYYEIAPDDIYKFVSETGALPKTAAPSPLDYVERFKKWVDDGYKILWFGISSHFSAAFASASIAAEELSGVYCIDSRNLSTGIAHLVIEAAELAAQGMKCEDIAAHIKGLIPRVDVSFILDTLLYLWKGGRCSGVAALGSNILRLKPCIEVTDGKMGVGKKYRGALIDVIEKYVAERLEGRTDLDLRRIFITHSGGYSEEELARVKAAVLRYQPFEQVYITRAGCTVSSHCGPKTLGILYIHKS